MQQVQYQTLHLPLRRERSEKSKFSIPLDAEYWNASIDICVLLRNLPGAHAVLYNLLLASEPTLLGVTYKLRGSSLRHNENFRCCGRYLAVYMNVHMCGCIYGFESIWKRPAGSRGTNRTCCRKPDVRGHGIPYALRVRDRRPAAADRTKDKLASTSDTSRYKSAYFVCTIVYVRASCPDGRHAAQIVARNTWINC